MVAASQGPHPAVLSVRTQVEVAAVSSVGLVRARNEDAYLVTDLNTGEVATSTPPDSTLHLPQVELGQRGLLLVVADGTGGTGGGDVASRLVCDLCAESADSLPAAGSVRADVEAALTSMLVRANAEVRAQADRGVGADGMGSTAVVVYLRDRFAHHANVGDSRLYVMRQDRLVQKTRDQIAPTPTGSERRADDLLQAIGWEELVEPVCGIGELRSGDILMLCTDGVTNELADAAIRDQLADPQRSLLDMAAGLVQAGVACGGRDNLTVVLVRVLQSVERPPGPLRTTIGVSAPRSTPWPATGGRNTEWSQWMSPISAMVSRLFRSD